MNIEWWMAVPGVVAVCLAAMAVAWWFWRRNPQEDEQAVRDSFRRVREWLEAEFFTLAAQSGSPRGLAWVDCDFADPVAFARDRRSGELRAFVAVSIRFEAVEGGGMEDNPNVSNVRSATAVFLHRRGTWITEGRAIMNLNPHQAIDRFGTELEAVE